MAIKYRYVPGVEKGVSGFKAGALMVLKLAKGLIGRNI
jgi:hypothetical protein